MRRSEKNFPLGESEVYENFEKNVEIRMVG